METHQEGQEKRSHADWILFFAGIVLFSALGFWLTPTILYAEKAQPFNFDHKLHMEQVGEGCKSCHFLREDGSFSGIPGIASCKECHEEAQGETPDEKVFVEQYVKKNKPVPWLVYSRQPACVFFSHAAHTANDSFKCAECHGELGTNATMPPYQYNRLTGYSRDIWGWSILGLGGPPDRMKMDDCANCHRDNGVRDACFVCHK